ncbi:Fc.00g045030.m01.CDS01 [Cosmosporella sp. VM-42]
MSTSNGISGFSKLSNWVSYCSPSSSGPNSGSETPSLVVLCTWASARTRHIAKYTAGYQKLYPSASILIVQTWSYDVILRPTDRWHLARLQPACDIILSFLDANQDGGGIRVFHAFSNAGALAAGLLLTMLRSSRPLTKDVFHALLLDSCPGQGGYWALSRAMIVSLRFNTYPYPVYAAASLLTYIGALYLALGTFLGMENIVDRIRRRLNDEDLVDRSVPRLYLCSKTDELVHWKDVASHAAEAKQKGYETQDLMFQGSSHCAHLQKDAGRYWCAVSDFLRAAERARPKL